ncbi:MAG: hypothetical protein WCH34_10685, partial [Bacteroidota bacterium]
MKKTFTFLFNLALIAILFAPKTHAQNWEPVKTGGFSAGEAHITRIAFYGNTPYVVYKDYSNNNKATVKKYDGANWVSVGVEGFSAGEVDYLSIAIDGAGTPYVGYQDRYNGSRTTVMKFNGFNWENVGTPGFSSTSAFYASLALNSSGTPYLAYQDGGNDYRATVKKFDGSNWVTVGAAGISTGIAENESFVISNDDFPYLAYIDDANGHRATVKKFDGSNWVTVGTEGFSVGTPFGINLTLDGSIPYVAFADGANSQRATVMKFNGANWQAVGAAGFSTNTYIQDTKIKIINGTPYIVYSTSRGIVQKFDGSNWVNVGDILGYDASFTSISYDAIGTPFVVYSDGYNSNKATVKKFNGSNWEAVTTGGFSAGEAKYTSIKCYSNTPYVAYEDNFNGNKATVMKFNGSNWLSVGAPGFSAGEVRTTSIAINGTGIPYVVYKDWANAGKVTVMKFDGSSWVTVGSAGFSAGESYYTSIAIDGSGTPYVFYQDVVNGNKATVMKFNGSNWVTVGSAGFSAGITLDSYLAIDGSGTPYVVYGDEANSYKATVMKFNGSNWVAVGSAGFSAGEAMFTSMAFDHNGIPYVVYEDLGNSYKATVMKFNGSNWVSVGSAGFSTSGAQYTSIAFYGNIPYVAYEDLGNSFKTTVKKFDGSSWITVGTAGFSAGEARNTSIAFSYSGIPYVAYADVVNGVKATVMRFPCASPYISSQYTDGQTQCLGGTFTPISVTASGTNLVYQWYSNTTASIIGGTPVGTNSNSYNPLTNNVGTLYYYCILSGDCGTATSEVSGAFIVNANAEITNQSTDGQTHCLGGAFTPITVTATGTNLNYRWYSNTTPSTTGGSLVGAYSNSFTPWFVIPGTLYYYCVVQSDCGIATSDVSGAFIVNPNTEIISQSIEGQMQCAGGLFNPISVNATGSNLVYEWYSNTIPSTSGGTLIGTFSESFTPFADSPGTLYYYCIITGDCGTVTSEVSGAFSVFAESVYINSQSTASQSQCIGGTFNPISVTTSGPVISYQWYSNNTASTTGGTEVGTNSNSYTPSANNAGTLYYYCKVTGVCADIHYSDVSGAFIVNTIPNAPTGAASQSFCSGNSPTVVNLAATGAAIKWYAAASGGSALSTNVGLVNGTHYYASQTVNSCESSSRLNVTAVVNTTPNAPTGAATQTFCSGTSPTVANLSATGSNIKWYAASSGGSALSTSLALVNGNHYYASQTTNGCESSSRLNVTVTVNTTPGAPIGNASQTFCLSTSPTVANLSATGTAVKWYNAASGGSVYLSTDALVNGNHYYASQTVSGCEGSARLDVTATISAGPAAPTGSAIQIFCLGFSHTVADLVATGTAIKWYSTASGGSQLS